jgi:hypothetical protein
VHTDKIANLKRLLTEFGACLDEAGRQLAHANNLRQQAEAVISQHEHDCLHEANAFATDPGHPSHRAPAPGSDPADNAGSSGYSRGGS